MPKARFHDDGRGWSREEYVRDEIERAQGTDFEIEPSSDTAPARPVSPKYGKKRPRYPWPKILPGQWFFFPPNVTPPSARAMASNAAAAFHMRFTVYMAADEGRMVCQRIDGLPESLAWPEPERDPETGRPIGKWLPRYDPETAPSAGYDYQIVNIDTNRARTVVWDPEAAYGPDNPPPVEYDTGGGGTGGGGRVMSDEELQRLIREMK